MAPASFLDAVTESIIQGADSLDAHIDADSLVEQLAGATTPGSRQSRKALSRLKDLAQQAPTAVAASRGAVPALLRAVESLAPKKTGSDNHEVDDWEEPLQDALEAITCLISESSAPSGRASPSRAASSPKKGDEAAARRSEDIADLVVRHTQNGKQLLPLLGVQDLSIKYDTMVLVQRVYTWRPDPIEKALLEEPLASIQLMETLQNCHVDYVRNECLSLLLLLTATNGEIQKIFAIQGLVERIFEILEEEDLTRGGKVTKDLLRCLMNLIGNVTCQKHIRETGGFKLLVDAMSAAITGEKPGVEEDDEDYRMDIPDELRWACLGLLADASLAIASGGAHGESGEPLPEASPNQGALVRAGAVKLCKHLLDARIALSAKLRIAEVLGAVMQHAQAARALQSYDGNDDAPPLFTVTAALLGRSTPSELRNALGRILGRALAWHPTLQSFLCSSLSPQLEVPQGGVEPAGRQVIGLLEDAAVGLFEGERCWFALHLVLGMLFSNSELQSVCVSLPVAVPSDAGPPETFLGLVFRVFSACTSAVCNGSSGDSAQSPEPVPASPGPSSPAATLIAVLKLIVYWLSSCEAALVPFATNAVTLTHALALTCAGDMCTPFFRIQIEGLASLLIGACIKVEQGDVDVVSLMAKLASHVGIEGFQQKVDLLWRSEPLQRPARGLCDLRWYSGRFRTFFQQQKMSVQRRMVQLYVLGGVGQRSDGTLSADVADHYKQLIRVQDQDFREVQRENEHLRREVEGFMKRSLQASSIALVEKMEALQNENDALHEEVEQLTDKGERQEHQLADERDQARRIVGELEQQLQSVAVGYEQVEQKLAAMNRENSELREKLALQANTNSSVSAPIIDREAAAKQNLGDLRAQNADLLDLLGRVVAGCPEAAAFVAPLGKVDPKTQALLLH